MNAEIIAVGTELLLGQIANTNAQFLSIVLARIGINVFYHSVVGDNQARLIEVIETANKRSDLIIFTGGLGPTKDDLTKETVASVLSLRLAEDSNVLNKIDSYFKRQNRQMTENNRKQALVIEGSTVLQNDFGTAPGIALSKNDRIYMLFPGPPSELKPMFNNYGRPFLLEQLEIKEHIESRVLKFFGIGESQLETEVLDLIDAQSNPTIAPLIEDGEATLRLTAKDLSFEKATKMLDEVERAIQNRVGQYFYGYNGSTLYKEVFELLKTKKMTVSSAESLTGGGFANELTNFAGSSSIFKGSIVCYDTEVKRNILKVPNDVIAAHGVVSQECVQYMAENVRQLLNTDIGISFTGVAGPDKQEGKPVGTVFVGIAINGKKTKIFTLNLAGSRSGIRTKSVKYGYFHLLKILSRI
ncbi:competence/damage-inducible protein A [Schinkia azotoformans]|uniref:competence/damage-inducible protein A n=1 Tax=Schinkia azotoformans TaxID=1454 RepID=UPI002DB85FA5|nr:competence/damage-inducible protein A [Schinkia azotoformans]MEC1721931.1 competence/damage-inducible protein A [Schinkia azotoformans]MED4411685.1 competence/damage-inducible protein A [Schinkia azotoformans]